MMGLGKCKDLDEWLMGSGESALTTDSKGQINLKFGTRHDQKKLVQPGACVEPDDDAVDSAKDDEDWMFQTFDKSKLLGKPKATKEALDPFGDLKESKLEQELMDFSKEVSWNLNI